MKSRYAARGTWYELDRRAFLKRTSAALAAAMLGCQSKPDRDPSLHAPTDSRTHEVSRWDVLTIGNLSRNRYWGESDERGLRSAICTSTLVQVGDQRLICDPSMKDVEEMAHTLDRRTGFFPDEIQTVFVTHEHGDHWFGIEHFENAEWYAAPPVAEILNNNQSLTREVRPIEGTILDVIEIVPTPGHTVGHHGLLFTCDGMRVMLAGDSVATRDFFIERKGYYNVVDEEESARTMDWMKENVDIIVPGHDNYFLARNTD